MGIQNENVTSQDNQSYENLSSNNSSNNNRINDAMSFLTNRSRRYRRESYDEDDYEIVCKHSNTGNYKISSTSIYI